ncbi:hypothetical protein NNL56_14565 [Enterococcus faecium]|nr:hypothetical protein [Enterococcus faecium]
MANLEIKLSANKRQPYYVTVLLVELVMGGSQQSMYNFLRKMKLHLL